MHGAIGNAGEGGVREFQSVEGGGEGHGVDEKDSEQCKAAKCVDIVDAVGVGHSCSP
ncbi:hypothetical protein D9M72_448970 [compost metagenome]